MKKKNIHVLLVEPGKAPRSVTVRNTPEGIAEAIGSEEWEKVPIQQDKGPDAVFLSVVMVCRTADLEKEPNPNGGIPGTVLICGIDGNDLTSLPLFLQKQFLASYGKYGDNMIQDGGSMPAADLALLAQMGYPSSDTSSAKRRE